MTTSVAARRPSGAAPASAPAWTPLVDAIRHRHPAVGLAIGVVRDGDPEILCNGNADLVTGRPVTEETVFRIGSITKTMTALAVMQLWEEGRVDLDAPASEYLVAYRITLRKAGFRQPTLRHLLTHTSGIPDVRRFVDLLHVTAGAWDARPPTHSVPMGTALPSLAEYYAEGLEVVAEPGSAFAYSNHAFATLGQIVEDVSGLALDRYLRERIFVPLGMVDTDLRRSDRIAARLAVGYGFGRTGPRPVPDRDWVDVGAGGVYSTVRDLARYAAALLGGGANEHGRVLRPPTLATMYDVHYQNHPALPAMGLAFFRTDLGGHRVLSHDGIVPGFNSHLAVLPDERIALIALTNGSSGAMRWIPGEMERLQRSLLGLTEDAPRLDIPHHPEVWDEICGRYQLPAHVGDMRGRLALGPGLEVLVRGGQPVVRLLWPVPALRRGAPLLPDDEVDPRALRADLSGLGMGQLRLRFRRESGTARKVIHSDLGGQPVSFDEVPGPGSSARWIAAAAGALAVGAAAAGRRRRSRRSPWSADRGEDRRL